MRPLTIRGLATRACLILLLFLATRVDTTNFVRQNFFYLAILADLCSCLLESLAERGLRRTALSRFVVSCLTWLSVSCLVSFVSSREFFFLLPICFAVLAVTRVVKGRVESLLVGVLLPVLLVLVVILSAKAMWYFVQYLPVFVIDPTNGAVLVGVVVDSLVGFRRRRELFAVGSAAERLGE